jgi:ubiquinone/menaquinone biosynthesis C-methylase UbiE
VELDERKRQSFEAWEGMAPGWEKRRADIDETTAPVREWLVRELAPEAGDTILELAAGPGDTGFQAAALLGESGRLISSDFSPAMVEVGRRRAAELGVGENVEHRVLDAQSIDLPDDSVDGVLCRFGYMLMPDPAAALAETRRVLRPGGRLALAVWREPERNPWIAIGGRLLTQRGYVPPPEPGAPSMFALASDERLGGMLADAGFTVLRMEEVPVQFVYTDVDQWVGSAVDTGGMFAKAWVEIPEDEQAEIKEELAAAFEPFAVEEGYDLPGVTHCAVAG